MYDIGDKVWHCRDQVEVTIVERKMLGEALYKVSQSEEQALHTGRVSWVAWLKDNDLCPSPPEALL